MISRIFGFIRDVATASMFGAGPAFDAFIAAFKIPNFMRRLFAEGSFSQAFVPVLSEYQKTKSEEETKSFINAMSGTLGMALVFVTLLGILAAPYIIRVFTPGFDVGGDRFDLAVTMLRITFPYLLFISLTAFSGAILNTYSRFWVAAFTPVVLNLSMISAALFFAPHYKTPIIVLAWGVFAAGVLQLLFQWPFLRNLKMMPRPRVDFKDPGVRKVLKLMVPALFGVSVGQINLLVDTLFASLLVVGSLSWLYYADRLMELPLGVFGVAISTVILPHLSRHHAGKSQRSFSQTIDWAIRAVLLVGVPAAIALMILAGPMISTLFQHVHFSEHAVVMSSQALIAFALGITPFMLVKIFASGFYARQDMKTPVRIGAVAMIANIILNISLIGPLKHVGIALSTTLAAMLNMTCLFYYLHKRGFYQPREGWLAFGFRLVAANTVMAAWLWFATDSTHVWVTQSVWWRISHLATIVTVGAGIYFASLWLAGIRLHHLLIPQSELVAE